MKPIKPLIVSLCLAIALMFSGAFVTNVYADNDPQNPRPADPPPPRPPSAPPDIIGIIITIIRTTL